MDASLSTAPTDRIYRVQITHICRFYSSAGRVCFGSGLVALTAAVDFAAFDAELVVLEAGFVAFAALAFGAWTGMLRGSALLASALTERCCVRPLPITRSPRTTSVW